MTGRGYSVKSSMRNHGVERGALQGQTVYAVTDQRRLNAREKETGLNWLEVHVRQITPILLPSSCHCQKRCEWFGDRVFADQLL